MTLYLNCLAQLYNLMKAEGTTKMTAVAYEKKRRRLHKYNPQKYAELTKSERLAIRAMLSQNKFSRLKLNFVVDEFGQCTDEYVIVA